MRHVFLVGEGIFGDLDPAGERGVDRLRHGYRGDRRRSERRCQPLGVGLVVEVGRDDLVDVHRAHEGDRRAPRLDVARLAVDDHPRRGKFMAGRAVDDELATHLAIRQLRQPIVTGRTPPGLWIGGQGEVLRLSTVLDLTVNRGVTGQRGGQFPALCSLLREVILALGIGEDGVLNSAPGLGQGNRSCCGGLAIRERDPAVQPWRVLLAASRQRDGQCQKSGTSQMLHFPHPPAARLLVFVSPIAF